MSWMLVAHAEPLDPEAYARRFALRAPTDPSFAQVERCLARWPDHPFATDAQRRFRVLEGSVRVLGLGTAMAVVDDVPTTAPQLLLVKPSVNVGSRTTWSLQNPNGWYCFDTTANVGGKNVVNVACGAHVADGSAAVDLGGRSDNGGIVLLGNVSVNRSVDCPEAVPDPIGRCLAAWGDHPFTTPALRRARVFDAVVKVVTPAGDLSLAVDGASTPAPELVWVKTQHAQPATRWQLANPNGWYCVDDGAAVPAGNTFEPACGARVADGGAAARPGAVGAAAVAPAACAPAP